MNPGSPPNGKTKTAHDCLKGFLFPGGEHRARQMRGVKVQQRGEICLSPGAHWMPFTAEQRIDATRSSFCWRARFGGAWLTTLAVTDAYEDGHGRLSLKLGGVIPVKSFAGPDVDKAEIQRYLAEIVMCPPILLNHPSLEFTASGNRTLRVGDRTDPTGATVDFELSEKGCPVACRADRPRIVGNNVVLTPWSGVCKDFRDWQGLRVPYRFEVSWHLPEGAFTYFRAEVTSYAALG